MNTNETQLINSMLALAALSANISPEELKEYVNVLSSKENPSKVRSDDRFSDADILRSAMGLLRAYRDKHVQELFPEQHQPFTRRFIPVIEMLEECLEYFFPNKD